ncbi:MAG: hypothetical protein AB4050_20020 [Synechococcus sp.]
MKGSRDIKRQSLGKRVDRQVEKVIHRVMTNNGLEETISNAVQKALVELVTRYLALAVVAMLLLLTLHSSLLVILIKSNFSVSDENSTLKHQP